MRVAAVQMCSTDDVAANLRDAERFVEQAASQGAGFIALPENFAFLRREGEPIPCAQSLGGPILDAVRGWARRFNAWILAGSFPEEIPDEKRVHNTSVLISAAGEIAAVYRKIHLFDVDLRAQGGAAYQESETIAPGKELVVADTPFGKLGLSICYDLRFPELYRALSQAGAQWITVPSAFTPETGKDHWEVLLRARAIENQLFVVAPAQWGRHSPERASYGRSLILDPWGGLLAQAPDRPGVIVAECDLEDLERVRNALPSLHHRKL